MGSRLALQQICDRKTWPPFRVARLFSLLVPAGNNFAVYVPTVEENNGTTERLTGVGYLELEAPNLDASIKFYEQVLGFKVLERGRDAQSNKT